MIDPRGLAFERLEGRTLLTANLHAALHNPFDIDGDGRVNMSDVRPLVADLAMQGQRQLAPGEAASTDVDGDGLVTLEDFYWLRRRIDEGPKWDGLFPLRSAGEPQEAEPGDPPMQTWIDAEPARIHEFALLDVVQEVAGNHYYTAGAGDFVSSELIPIDPSETLAVQGRFRAATDVAATVELGLEFYDASFAPLAGEPPAFVAAAEISGTSSAWQYLVSDLLAGNEALPLDAQFVKLVLRVQSSSSGPALVHVDDVGIREVVDVTSCSASGQSPAADGVTDDTAALQHCIDSLPDGSTLYFPAGRELLVNGQLFVGSDVSLLGASRETSGLKLDADLFTAEDPRFAFWLNFGLYRRYGDLLYLDTADALRLSRGTNYTGRVTNLRFELTENARTSRAVILHSADQYILEGNFFDGSQSQIGESISWLSQQIVGASLGIEGYISSGMVKSGGVVRDNEMRLRQSDFGGEQIGLGPLASDMVVQDNSLFGAGDDCFGIHQVSDFKIVDNFCESVDGRVFVGGSTRGLVQGNRLQHVKDALDVWGRSGSLVEVTVEGSVNPKNSTEIVIAENHLSAGDGEPISFGIRVRGSDNIQLTDNLIASYNGSIDAPKSTATNVVLRDVFYGIRVEHFQNGTTEIAPGDISVVGNRVRTYDAARAQVSNVGLAPTRLLVEGNQAEAFKLGTTGVEFGVNEIVDVRTAEPAAVRMELETSADGPVIAEAFTTGNIRRVEFVVDGQVLATDAAGDDGWTATLDLPMGSHQVAARAVDIDDVVVEDQQVIDLVNPVLLAADYFVKLGLGGGEQQWSTGRWSASGNAQAWTGGVSPGYYSTLLRAAGASLERSVDVSPFGSVELAFQSRLWSIEDGDQVLVQMRDDEGAWTTVLQHGRQEADNRYHPYRVVLEDPPEQLDLRFHLASGDSLDWWFVDNVEVFGLTARQTNQSPQADEDAYALDEDQLISPSSQSGVLQGDADADGDALAARLVSPPDFAAEFELLPDGGFSYRPQANYYGEDQFVYQADDGTSLSDPATVSLTVRPVNDAPQALAQSIAAEQDTPVALVLEGVDPDSTQLTYEVAEPPQFGQLSGAGPERTYTPQSGFLGVDTFSFVVSDGALQSDAATITVTVAENQPPVADDQTLTTWEDQAAPVLVTAVDAENDPLTFEVVEWPELGTLSGELPAMTFEPQPDAHGDTHFVFRAFDGMQYSDPATVSISIGAVNDPPTATSFSTQVSEDDSVEVSLAAADVDDDPLTMTVARWPAHGLLSGTGAVRTYVPDPDFHGADSFVYTAGDGKDSSEEATVHIDVLPLNDPPDAQDLFLATVADTPTPATLLATDIDGDELSYTIAAAPGNGTLTGASPHLTYVPDAGFTGVDLFTFVASDGTAESGVATVTIQVDESRGPRLSHGVIEVSSDWSTVELPYSYSSMVVVATPNYDNTGAPAVVRVREARGDSFQLRLAPAAGPSPDPVLVHYVVAEEGVYDEPGFKMEAVKYASSVTDGKYAWGGESRAYQQAYEQPVVVGQVMTANDADWSAFWSSGSDRRQPPASSQLTVGKHVGESPDRQRVDETVGYLVIETSSSGQQMIEGLPYVAGVGADIVVGVGKNPGGVSYSYAAMPNAKTVVASQAGMDGKDGSWVVLYGADPITPTGSELRLTLDEDVESDNERRHTDEQVAYFIIDPPMTQAAASSPLDGPPARPRPTRPR